MPAKKGSAGYHNGRKGKAGHKDGELKTKVLEAWKCGDRSFDEVVEITGLKPYQVAYYLPIGIGRIK